MPLPVNGYLLRIYGPPEVPDLTYDDAHQAIEQAKLTLQEDRCHFAELVSGRHGVIWNAYFDREAGVVKESYKQPPESEAFRPRG